MSDAEMEAYHTACTIVLAHLKSAEETWQLAEIPACVAIRSAADAVRIFRDWTPDMIARALAEVEEEQE